MFRGIDIKTGEWVYGYYKYHPYYDIHLICVYEKKLNILQPPDGIWAEHEVHSDSIAMNTGQVDKNNKVIFGSILNDGKMSKGGDICKVLYPCGQEKGIGNVIYDRGGFGVDIPYAHSSLLEDIEIIGTQWKQKRGKK